MLSKIRNLLKRDQEIFSPSHPRDPALRRIFNIGAPTEAGVSVSADNALSVSAAYTCATMIAETIAMLPLRILNKSDDSVATNHPLSTILTGRPNNEQTRFEWLEMMVLNFLLDGRGVSIIERRGQRITGLRPIPYHALSVRRSESGRIVYLINLEKTGQTPFFRDEVVDLRGPTVDGVKTLTPIEECASTFGVGIAADNFSGRFLSRNDVVRAVLQTDEELSDAEYERLLEWKQQHQGFHGAPILEHGLQYKPIAVKPSDAQLIELKNLSRKEIAAIYRVPPAKIGEGPGLSSVEQNELDFIADAIAPRITRFESAMEHALLSDRELLKFKINFDLNALLRADFTTRTTRDRTLWSIGARNANEIRAGFGMSAIDGGDRYFVPSNMIPADRVDDVVNRGPGQSPVDAGDEDSIPKSTGVSN